VRDDLSREPYTAVGLFACPFLTGDPLDTSMPPLDGRGSSSDAVPCGYVALIRLDRHSHQR
jgi:hypothetical protein